jgi:hypothetical protein
MSADCSLQVVESQHRSGDLILANDNVLQRKNRTAFSFDEPQHRMSS